MSNSSDIWPDPQEKQAFQVVGPQCEQSLCQNMGEVLHGSTVHIIAPAESSSRGLVGLVPYVSSRLEDQAPLLPPGLSSSAIAEGRREKLHLSVVTFQLENLSVSS